MIFVYLLVFALLHSCITWALGRFISSRVHDRNRGAKMIRQVTGGMQ